MMGDRYPAYIIAEVGINHNGDLDAARKLLMPPRRRGCGEVPKRAPGVSTPLDQQKQMRETPWGYITYLIIVIKLNSTQSSIARLTAIAGKEN